MSATNPHVFDVTRQSFQERVLQRSQQVPVVVDFWAPWCGPCKTLGPLLEKLALEWRGGFELAKVNVDEHPDLASAFQVRGIPAVFGFSNGQPVDAFTGAQPPEVVRQFIERLAPKAADPLADGQAALAAGDLDVAAKAFQTVLAEQPESGEALLGLARVCLARGDAEGAEAFIDRIDEANPAYTVASRLRQALTFHDDAGSEAELRARVELDPADLQGWYRLGATYAVQGRLELALEAFLRVVELDRSFQDDAGRIAMIAVFDMLGDDPLVARFRRKLSFLLF